MRSSSIHIAQPCPESWDAMTPTGPGRHCLACQKTVVDFTWKTDAEILAYLTQAAGETCGRLRADQLNRPLVLAAAAGPAQQWRAWLAATLALWGVRESSGLGAEARTGPPLSTHRSPASAHKPRHSAPASKVLRGTVRDATTQQPLAGVAVFLKGENRATTTNAAGQFSLPLPSGRPAARRPHLVLHHAGYLSRQLSLAPTTGAVQVELHTDPAAGGVEVVAQFQQQRRDVLGGAVALISVTNEQAPPPPVARPGHGFFYWLTRPFRRR